MRHAGAAISIHDDAIGDGATCRSRQLQFHLKPDANQNDVDFDDLAAVLDREAAAARHDGAHIGIEPDIDVMLLRQIPEGLSKGFRQKPRHDLRFALEQGDGEPARRCSRCKLEADETTADDSDMRAASEGLFDRHGILDRSQMQHIGKIAPGDRKTPGTTAGRKQKRVIRQRGSIIETDAA